MSGEFALLFIAPDPEERRRLEQDTRTGVMLGLCPSLMVVATAAVALRLWARKKAKIRLQAEDWTIIVALALNYAHLSAVLLATTRADFGHHSRLITTQGFGAIARLLKYFFTIDCLFIVSSNVTRLSILLFYRGLFRFNQHFRRALYLLFFLIFAQAVAFFFVNIFQCRPIKAFWDRLTPRHTCITRTHFLLPQALCNVLADLFILTLPMPILWSLQIDVRKKIAVGALFVLGSGSCIFAILRVPTFFGELGETTDPFYDGVLAICYTLAETSIGIVCACIPLMGPLVRNTRLAALFSRLASRITGSRVGVSAYGRKDSSLRKGSALNDLEDYHQLNDVSSAGAAKRTDSLERGGLKVEVSDA